MDKEKMNKLGRCCSSLGGAIVGALLGMQSFGISEVFDGYRGIILIFWIAGIGLLIGGIVISISAHTQQDSPQSSQASTTLNDRANTDPVQELKQYKELLDTGVITQEEYDEKKKQLLNI